MTLRSADGLAPAEVFLASPWIPAEYVSAHGLKPRPVLSAPGFGSAPGSPGAGVCAFGENVLDFARRAPGAVVFPTHCDQLRRAFDALPPNPRASAFLFNLPVTVHERVMQHVFGAELERLGRFLVALGGQRPEPEALFSQMRLYDAARARLRQLGGVCAGRAYARAVARFHSDRAGEAPDPAQFEESGVRDGARLALVGGPLTADAPLWDQLEAAGAQIVLNATEWGERSLGVENAGLSQTEAAGQSAPTDLLCRRFALGCVDVFQRPNDRLYEWLGQKLRTRRVQGIVLWHYFGCDLWRAEAQSLKEAFGLPLLVLEADESGSAAERNVNRIEAFVEALK